jgi:hypothetical protein
MKKQEIKFYLWENMLSVLLHNRKKRNVKPAYKARPMCRPGRMAHVQPSWVKVRICGKLSKFIPPRLDSLERNKTPPI